MTPSALRLRILAAIGTGGLALLATEACGGSPSVTAGADAAADARGEASNEAAADVLGEAGAADAPVDSTGDAAPDARMSVRRPLLVGASLRAASLVSRDDWVGECRDTAPAGVDARTLAALAKAYALDGCEEHASIAAFARLTLHLLSIGAPPDLVEKAHLASLDEIRHARSCFALARRYGGGVLGPSALSIEDLFAPRSAGESSLADIAALCAEEGCVGETLGVLLASEALARTEDRFVRTVLTSMLEDEASHVDLAWRVVRWCIGAGREPVRAAVDCAIRRGIAATRRTPLRRYDGVDLLAWNAHGRVTCEQARAAAERGIRDVVEPCARLLLEAGRGSEASVSSAADLGGRTAASNIAAHRGAG